MKKSVRILIIGLGSIGKRHYRNLLALGYRNVWVYDVDSRKVKSQKSKVKNLDQKTLRTFDVVFVCSPNHLHIKHAMLAAKAGCHIFIEKPLSHDMKGVTELEKICQKKKLITMVGCNMRFHPCLQFIKKYMHAKKLGKVYTVACEFGSYLPSWRPGQDYRKNFAATKSTGGGIILDDIHEFDLLFWLNDFAAVEKARFVFGKLSNLQINTEDTCVAAFRFKNQTIGSVRCDYLQRHYSRSCKIVGEKGNLEWNFNENTVWLKNLDGTKALFKLRNFRFNKVYLDEIKYFLKCVAKKHETFNDIKHAAFVLKYCVQRP